MLTHALSLRDKDSADARVIAELEAALVRRPAGPFLRFTCLGGFQILDENDRPCSEPPPPPKRGRELIQYLALRPARSASRGRLGDLFWPELDGDGLNHRLHIAASGARAFLRCLLDGFDAIACTPDGYSWHPAVRIDSDVFRFADLFRSGSLDAFKRAVPLYSGELFEGDESDWLQRERIRYATMFATMLEHLARSALAEGDADEALAYGLELLSLDRADEGASRLVMTSFGALGRRGSAFSEYLSLHNYLRRQLGIEPMAETQNAICKIMGWTQIPKSRSGAVGGAEPLPSGRSRAYDRAQA